MVQGRLNCTGSSGIRFLFILYSHPQVVVLAAGSKQTHQLRVHIPLGKEGKSSFFFEGYHLELLKPLWPRFVERDTGT